MPREHTNMMMLPKLRIAVEAVAEREHRTLSNAMECLIALGLRAMAEGADIRAEIGRYAEDKSPAE